MGRVFKTLVALLGGSTVGGALVIVLALTLGASETPDPQAHMPGLAPPSPLAPRPGGGWGPEDLGLAAALGGASAGLLLVGGLVAWIVVGGEKWFQDEIDGLYAEPWVRAVGIPLASGCVGGAVYGVAELSFASKEYPADFSDLWPFMGGVTFLALLLYLVWLGLKALLRRLFGGGALTPAGEPASSTASPPAS